MRAGGGACDGVGESGGSAFGNDHTVRACGEGGANDGAEIVRIFDAVEKDDEAFASVIGAFVGGGENAFERRRSARGGQGDDSLMIFRVGETIQLAAVFKADGNIARTSELDNFFDARVLAAARDQDAIEGAARVERFADGVDASELVHVKGSLQSKVES